MFVKAIEGINKLWGLREIFNVVFFWGYAIVINCAYFLWNGDYAAWIEKFNAIQKDNFKLTIYLTVILVIFVIFHTIIKWSFSFVIRLYEGYDFPLWISERLKGIMNQKMKKLAKEVVKSPQKLETLTMYFPHDTKFIMPTRLGNILRVAELYPWIRYDIDAVAVWPRLYQLVSKEQVEVVSGLKNEMTFLLNLSWLSYLSGLVWIVLTLFFVSWHGVVVVLLAGSAGYLFYRLALVPALNYALMIRVLFDLYRVPLLKALGEEGVSNLEEEIKAWKLISAYFKQGDLTNEQLKGMFRRKKE